MILAICCTDDHSCNPRLEIVAFAGISRPVCMSSKAQDNGLHILQLEQFSVFQLGQFIAHTFD